MRESSTCLGSWIPGQARNDEKVFLTQYTGMIVQQKPDTDIIKAIYDRIFNVIEKITADILE